MDLSFAALGWLNRAAQAAGSIRFTETARRARFYLVQAARHATTPAELAVITGLTASLEGLTKADADAKELLLESLSDFDAVIER